MFIIFYKINLNKFINIDVEKEDIKTKYNDKKLNSCHYIPSL